MNKLFYGDNLPVLRQSIPDESVDLIYLDPPFNSKAAYNVLFKSPSGKQSHAQVEAFEDTWHWGEEAESAFDGVMRSGNTDAAEILRAMRSFLKENDMMAYLCMMAIRLLELRRVLKPTGSIYLHCDPTASHYLKLIMDAVFGKHVYRNEVIWKRTSAHSGSKRWGPVHDTLLFFSKSNVHTWNTVFQSYSEDYLDNFYRFKDKRGRFRIGDLTGAGTRTGDSGRQWRGVNPTNAGRHWAVPNKAVAKLFGAGAEQWTIEQKLDALDKSGLIYWPEKGKVPGFKRYLNKSAGVPIVDVVTDLDPISAQSAERLGYPTQKPQALLERIISASSNEGDQVLDPFCGCGTAVHAAQKLRRQWIGIDITHLAIALIEKRLNNAFPGIDYEVHGTPKDIEGARNLASRDKYQFQWWAVSLVDAIPFGGKRRGADTGIDGVIYFRPEGRDTEKAVVSVKGGENVHVGIVRDFAHVIDREHAKIGVFITLVEPTGPMETEAVSAGFYETPFGKYRKLQILTIQDLFDGKQPNVPLIDPSAFKKAPKEQQGEQRPLPLTMDVQPKPKKRGRGGNWKDASRR